MRPVENNPDVVIAGKGRTVCPSNRGRGVGVLNGEWDNRVIANGDHDFVVHKLNYIDKYWNPDPGYQKMNPLEKRRIYLNQQKQKKSFDWSDCKASTSINTV